MNIQKTNETLRNINYLGMIITYYEDQTVGNCINNGIGTNNIKQLINLMRKKIVLI